MGKVDDMRALREARYGRQRDRRPVGLASRGPARSEPIERSSAKATLGTADQQIGEPSRPIHSYSSDELERIVRNLYTPGMTCDQATDAVVTVLGFKRKGKVIKVRVREAYEVVAQ